ncbi:MAG: methyltransferase domain-containing protein [Eubacterium sp.]|nr:methyltransferase domain-containing protein [Eubacterium sp.]
MKTKLTYQASDYDEKIKQTLPYYEEFYEQVIRLVKTHQQQACKWLDVGCGTGKMASEAFKQIEIEKFVFCDCSEEMLSTARERFKDCDAEFLACEVQSLPYVDQFDVVTAIQVNHYLQREERKSAIQNCYRALKKNGIFITFENFAPFSDYGKTVCLEKWKQYQLEQGKSVQECEQHVQRYGKNYFPITVTEQLELIHSCGFQTAEILWLSNMQAGFWAVK